jgi:hypothetical protein
MQPEITEKKIGYESSGAIPIAQRHGVTVQIAAEFTGISRTRIYELLMDGTIDGKVVRGRRIVLVASLLRMMGHAPSTKRQISA